MFPVSYLMAVLACPRYTVFLIPVVKPQNKAADLVEDLLKAKAKCSSSRSEGPFGETV